MVHLKLSFFIVVPMLITLAAFIGELIAQDSEANRVLVEEFVKKAEELVEQNKTVEAIDLYERIVKAVPDDFESYIKLAMLYETEGNEAAAIENYKKASEYEHGDKKVYLRLAEHFFLNEDMTAAEEALKNAITSTSGWDQEEIERQLINLYRYQGNLEEMLQKAEAEGTLTLEMQKQRARHFYNTGELHKAVIYFKKALEMTNNSSKRNEISKELVNLYLEQDRTDLALDFYESEISKQIQSKLISTFFSSSGITTNFGGDETRKVLINAYKNRGQLEELRTLFEGKLEKDSDNPAVTELLAEIYWDTNDYLNAAETYHILSKSGPMSRKNIRSFYHAVAAFHKSDQPDMVRMLLNQVDTAIAASNFNWDASFLGALATICLMNEIYDQAIKLATNAVSIAQKGTSPWSLVYQYEILAKSYRAVKRYEDAFETYQQMAKTADRSNHRERAKSGMNEVAKVGKLYEKWITEQLKQVEEHPNDPKRILKLAQSYEAADKIEEAIVQYERLSELESENSQWHTKLGTLYQNLPQENRQKSTVSEVLSPEQFTKSIAAYEKAVELEPTSYQLYDLLAKSYMIADRTFEAEKVYRRALGASLSMSNHASAVRALAGFYDDDGQEDKGIAVLEEFKPKMDRSAVLHELLGDLYKKVGDSGKAALVYDKWLQIRQKALNRAQSANSHLNFAEKLLDKGLYPETALFFAKRAFHKDTYSKYNYPATLGRACVANGRYEEALKHFKHALSLISDEHYKEMFWEEIAESIKNANHKERYIQMLESFINSISSESSTTRTNIYQTIAKFYGQNNMSENAEKYLLKAGFVPETAWITLGPFNNKDSVGYHTAYIPEETTQIDTTAKYFGRDKDKLISWEKSIDNKLDGRYDFGNDDGINDWSAAYVWAVVISPDERDITFRFDSDDQGIIWLNGKKVFEHSRASVGGGAVQIDRHTIPVTLKQGENTILLKVCNASQTWDFYMRLTDADSNSFEDLIFKTADALLNAPPPKPIFHVNVNLGLAEYYSINNMPNKAMEQMRQTGMIHENAWLVLGPFDNTAGIGYNTKYIPEGLTQIDKTAKYEGVGEQISWKEFSDDVFDGFIDLGKDINWRVAYTWATVTSPDEREVQFRFDSDDQSKMWLNGKQVFTNMKAQAAIVDRYTIPVKLKAGKNTLLVKVCNGELNWGFYLRITDTDGKPYEDLEFNRPQK